MPPQKPTPITDQTQLPLKMLATKSPVRLRFDARAANVPAYFAARWGVQTGGVSLEVADRELYGADRRVSGAPLAEKGPLQLLNDALGSRWGRPIRRPLITDTESRYYERAGVSKKSTLGRR